MRCHQPKPRSGIAPRRARVYKQSMARRASATVSLGPQDVRALARARALGLSASDLLRQGLRVAAAPYYQTGRRRRGSSSRPIPYWEKRAISSKISKETERPLVADTGGLLRALARRPGVAAVAERLRVRRILTIDHADFGPLRVGPRFDTAFDLVPRVSEGQ